MNNDARIVVATPGRLLVSRTVELAPPPRLAAGMDLRLLGL